MQPVDLALLDPERHLAGEDVDELLTGVGVPLLAPAAGLNLDPLRFERSRPRDQIFDHDQAPSRHVPGAFGGMENASMLGTVVGAQRRDGGAVGVRQFEEIGDGDAGLTTLDGTEKGDRQPGLRRHLRQRPSPGPSQPAQPPAQVEGWVRRLRRGRFVSRAEFTSDRRGVETVHQAQARDLPEAPQIVTRVEAVTSLGALRADEMLSLPQAQHAPGDARQPGCLADGMEQIAIGAIQSVLGLHLHRADPHVGAPARSGRSGLSASALLAITSRWRATVRATHPRIPYERILVVERCLGLCHGDGTCQSCLARERR